MQLLGPFRRQSLISLLNAGAADPSRAPAQGRLIAPAARIPLPPLPTGRHVLAHGKITQHPDGTRWQDDSYESVAAWVCTFHDALVFGEAGIVVIGDTVVEDTLLQTNPAEHRYREDGGAIFLEADGPATDLPGASLSLLNFNHGNYFHWTLDTIGRLGAADDATLAACDRVLAPVLQRAFQLEGFAHTGLADRLPMRMVGPGSLLRVERFVVPWSLSCDHRPHRLLPRTFCRWPSLAHPAARTWPERVYIDRRGSNNRRMVNEDELVSALERLDFMPVRLEALGLAEQITLFNQARIIVAPHGAGLANLVFARPGTSVIEIHSDSWVHWCFRHLAAVCALDYDCALGRTLPGTAGEPVHARPWAVSVLHILGAVDQALKRADPRLATQPGTQ